ncbi:MAG: UDP-N-acetylmuramate dehydrogenase [bacterium]|jgi:UDP-N-acetylmuramate dehydrogenase
MINIENLPKIDGEYQFNAPLAPYTTLKIGGKVDVLFTPQSLDELTNFMKNLSLDVPVTLLGEGSNMMLRDGGIRGVVIRLNEGLNDVTVLGNIITAGAGATGGKVARAAREHELTGIEFLCGIPGSVGGALKMNAGAYGHETADILQSVRVLTPTGDIKTLLPEDLDFSYRLGHLPVGWLFLEATFVLKKGNKQDIRHKMRQINKDRATSQPLNKPSSGSWFKNITLEDGEKIHAWQAVDEAGCRGMTFGGAQVSEKHCNFFINAHNATATDMETLTEMVEKQVYDKLGIVLQREVRFIGER